MPRCLGIEHGWGLTLFTRGAWRSKYLEEMGRGLVSFGVNHGKGDCFSQTKGLQEPSGPSDRKTPLNASDEKHSGLEPSGKFRRCNLAVFKLDYVLIKDASPLFRITIIILSNL